MVESASAVRVAEGEGYLPHVLGIDGTIVDSREEMGLAAAVVCLRDNRTDGKMAGRDTCVDGSNDSGDSRCRWRKVYMVTNV